MLYSCVSIQPSTTVIACAYSQGKQLHGLRSTTVSIVLFF